MPRDLYRAMGLLLTATLLAGCGSSPPVRYFALHPIAVDYEHDGDDVMVLGFGPMRLADYLKRSQMVTRGDDSEIIVDGEHRWAEPLDSAVQRVLATNVDRLLDSIAVVSFPDTDTMEIDYRLVGRVHRFDVDSSGTAVLEVQWRIQTGDGKSVIAPRRDRFAAGVSRRGDAGANATALTDTLGQYSRLIAEVARDLPPVSEPDGQRLAGPN